MSLPYATSSGRTYCANVFLVVHLNGRADRVTQCLVKSMLELQGDMMEHLTNDATLSQFILEEQQLINHAVVFRLPVEFHDRLEGNLRNLANRLESYLQLLNDKTVFGRLQIVGSTIGFNSPLNWYFSPTLPQYLLAFAEKGEAHLRESARGNSGHGAQSRLKLEQIERMKRVSPLGYAALLHRNYQQTVEAVKSVIRQDGYDVEQAPDGRWYWADEQDREIVEAGEFDTESAAWRDLAMARSHILEEESSEAAAPGM